MKKQKLFAAALSLSFALGAISPVFADSDELWTIDELVEENNRRAEEMRKLIEEDDYENSNKPSEKSNPPKKEDQASSGQVVDDGPCSEKGGPSIEKGGSGEVEEVPKSDVNNNVTKKAETDESIKELKEARDTARQLVATGKLLIKYYPNTIKKVRPQLEKLIRQAEALLYEADRLLAEYY